MIEVNRKGEVWVYAEQEDGQLHDVSLELCGKARELADRLGVRMGAVLPGANVRGLCDTLIGHGADVVYLTDDPHPAPDDRRSLACALHATRRGRPALHRTRPRSSGTWSRCPLPSR